MPRVLVVLGHVRSMSFAFELSAKLAGTTDADVTVISFYDGSKAAMDVPVADHAVDLVPLGATSRFDRTALRALRRHVGDGHDVVHTHHNFIGSITRTLAVDRDVAVVNTEHASHREHYSLAQNLVNVPTLPLADRIVSNSRYTQESFYAIERVVIPAKRMRVIYNGVDVERIDAVDPAERDGDGPRIAAIGRLNGIKNYETVLQAFERVREHTPGATLTIVGDGPRRPRLERLAREHGLAGGVEFTGFVDRDEVYARLHASDCFVHASRSEGFCVAAVEAMACGVPVVVSDAGALPEVVGDAGVLVDPTDPDAFASAMLDLLIDENRRTRLAARGRERARNEFPLAKTVDEYYRLYEECLAER